MVLCVIVQLGHNLLFIVDSIAREHRTFPLKIQFKSRSLPQHLTQITVTMDAFMSALHWGNHGVVTTVESTSFCGDDQKTFEIWSVRPSNTGAITPIRLGSQIGANFKEAVAAWAELEEKGEFFDPLAQTYNGLPLVESRGEASHMATLFNRQRRL